jgi:hypothetical protein
MTEAFLERDFKAYEKHRQDDPEYNALRLSVRRKLKGMADAVQKEAKTLGVELSAQAGLHHPYTFNAYRVREQRAPVRTGHGAPRFATGGVAHRHGHAFDRRAQHAQANAATAVNLFITRAPSI